MIASPALPPLFAPQPAVSGSPERAVLDRVAPFFTAGVLASIDLHVAVTLGRRAGVLDPDVLLAAALTVRAPRRGHLCVDLATLAARDLLAGDAGATDPERGRALDLPGPGWAERVRAATALVRDAADAGRVTPFVLAGSALYTDRYWSYQAGLGARVRAWASEAGLLPVADADLELLDRGLRELFRPPREGPDGPAVLNLQRVAGALALTRRYAVITGGPGMGKTWTVRNLLALLWLRHQRRLARGETHGAALGVALAAPTGKAAVRMREALRARLDEDFLPALGRFLPGAEVAALEGWMQQADARTLHRLLGFRHDAPTRFRHDRANPLPFDVVVVDEASMVDFPLMAKLVDAIGDRGPAGEPTRLVLLGDRHQLASVEAGTVLADLCGPTRADRLCFTAPAVAAFERFPSLAGFAGRVETAGRTRVEVVGGPPAHDAVVQFVRTFRFEEQSGIGAFAAACLVPGDPFDAGPALASLARGGGGMGSTRMLAWGEKGDLPAEIEDLVLGGYAPYLELLKQGWRAPSPVFPTEEVFHRRVLERFDRFRVLCAHRRDRGGVGRMNELALAVLRRAKLADPAGAWWTGRPILVERNDYNVRLSGGGRGLFNGDIGLVVWRGQGDDRRRMVAFPGPDSLPQPREGEDLPALADEHHEGRHLVDYVEPNRLPEHSTVFAMTIHKSQGSEYDEVLVALPREPSPILTRELIYTGVTRARRAVTVLGQRAVIEKALGATVRRASGLEAIVWAAGGGEGWKRVEAAWE